jgi:hypothetical protein
MDRVSVSTHHRRHSSVSTSASWFSEATTAAEGVSSPPSVEVSSAANSLDMNILGRTSPEIQKACRRLFDSDYQREESMESFCSAPTISMTSFAQCPEPSTMSDSKAKIEDSNHSELCEVSSSAARLRFLTINTTFANSNAHPQAQFHNIRHDKPPAKRHSPSKSHRRLSYDMLSTPQELFSSAASNQYHHHHRTKRTHRRNANSLSAHEG